MAFLIIQTKKQRPITKCFRGVNELIKYVNIHFISEQAIRISDNVYFVNL